MPVTSKRHTQFDLLALTGSKSSPSQPEAAKSQYSGDILGKKALNEKRARSPEADVGETASGGSKKISRLDRFQTTDPLRPKAIKESPWKYYEKIYDLVLAGPVQVAVRRTDPVELVHVRTFTNPGAEKALHLYQHIQHVNIITALAAFTTDTGLHVVLEAMPVSLEQVVQSPAYPSELQLAAILGQVRPTYP